MLSSEVEFGRKEKSKPSIGNPEDGFVSERVGRTRRGKKRESEERLSLWVGWLERKRTRTRGGEQRGA